MEKRRKMKVLIVEDDAYYNEILTRYVKDICSPRNYPGADFEIRSFKSAKECLENLEEDTNILVLDYFLDDYDEFPYNGFDIIRQVQRECKDCKVIVISSQRNVTVTTELFKKGIFDYIDKDYMPAKRLSRAIQKILNQQQDNGLAA